MLALYWVFATKQASVLKDNPSGPRNISAHLFSHPDVYVCQETHLTDMLKFPRYDKQTKKKKPQ